jgi:hypothetical protein
MAVLLKVGFNGGIYSSFLGELFKMQSPGLYPGISKLELLELRSRTLHFL